MSELILAILLGLSVTTNLAVVVYLLRQNHKVTELTLADQRRRVEWHQRPAVETSTTLDPKNAEALQPDEYWATTGNRRMGN